MRIDGSRDQIHIDLQSIQSGAACGRGSCSASEAKASCDLSHQTVVYAGAVGKQTAPLRSALAKIAGLGKRDHQPLGPWSAVGAMMGALVPVGIGLECVGFG